MTALQRLARVDLRRRLGWSVGVVGVALVVGAIWPEFAGSGRAGSSAPPTVLTFLRGFCLLAGLSLAGLLTAGLGAFVVLGTLDAWHKLLRGQETWKRLRRAATHGRQAACSTTRAVLAVCILVPVSIVMRNFLLFFALAFAWTALVEAGAASRQASGEEAAQQADEPAKAQGD